MPLTQPGPREAGGGCRHGEDMIELALVRPNEIVAARAAGANLPTLDNRHGTPLAAVPIGGTGPGEGPNIGVQVGVVHRPIEVGPVI